MLSTYSSRILHSNNIKQVTHIKEKHALLLSCNAFERAEQLSRPGERHQFAERLDADFLRMSIIAERRTKQFREPPWSIELAKARNRVSILSKALPIARTGLNHIDIIQRELEKYPDEVETRIPETPEEWSTALKQAKNRVREIVNRSFVTRESERDQQIAKLESEIRMSKPTKAMKEKLTILRNLKKAEAIKKLFKKSRIYGARDSGAVSHDLRYRIIPTMIQKHVCTGRSSMYPPRFYNNSYNATENISDKRRGHRLRCHH
jgi:hypothetical protein